MSGRGRNSTRRGLKTTMVNVRMTAAELAGLDRLRRPFAPGHYNMVLESRADAIRRAVAKAVEDISNQVVGPGVRR